MNTEPDRAASVGSEPSQLGPWSKPVIRLLDTLEETEHCPHAGKIFCGSPEGTKDNGFETNNVDDPHS